MTNIPTDGLSLYVAMLAISNMLMGVAMMLRTDDLIKAVKAQFGMKSYEHLPLGWMSVVGALLNLFGAYLAVSCGVLGIFILWAARK